MMRFSCARGPARRPAGGQPSAAVRAGAAWLVVLFALGSISGFTSHIRGRRGAAGKWRQDPLAPSAVRWYEGLFGKQGGARGGHGPLGPRRFGKGPTEPPWVLRTARGLPTPRALKEPEFPPPVLFRFRFGFLLGRRGVRLRRVRRRCDLRVLKGVEMPQDRLQSVLLLLEV